MDLSVIIVSYNTSALLRDCLRSVCSTLEEIDHETIVVDNASTDGSPEMVEKEFSDVRLIRKSVNAGFAGGNNEALRIAKGRYALLLNSDAVLQEGTVETLMALMDSKQFAAAVGPRVLNSDGTLQSKGASFPSVFLSFLDLLRIPKYLSTGFMEKVLPYFFWVAGATRPVDWVSGCCMLLRKGLVDEIGGLSEDFFMYYEDVEWCRRARNRGLDIWYCGVTEIVHRNLASPFPGRTEAIRRSALTYYMKTDSRLSGFAISLIRILFYLTRLTSLLVLSGITDEFRSVLRSIRDESLMLGLLMGISSE